MNRPILSIEHVGPIPRVYIEIGGYTKEGAQRNAKVISRVLRERLQKTHIIPPIFLRFDSNTGKHVFRIIIYEFEDQEYNKVVLSELALKGSV